MTDPLTGSLIAAGGALGVTVLSGTGKALIEASRDFVAGALEPTQIVRVAKANAEALQIETQAKLDAKRLEQKANWSLELQQRAFDNWAATQVREQLNREAILIEATAFVEETATPEEIERDWLAEFFAQCPRVSDETMRKVWGRLLAGEANAPGSFSKQTIQVVSQLDRADAERFAELCRIVWNFGDYSVPFVPDPKASELATLDAVQPDNLRVLAGLGLIEFNQFQDFVVSLGREFQAEYLGRTTVFRTAFDDRRRAARLENFPTIAPNIIPEGQLEEEFQRSLDERLSLIGKAILTRAGKQLLSISGASPYEWMWEYGLMRMRQNDYWPEGEEPGCDESLQPVRLSRSRAVSLD